MPEISQATQNLIERYRDWHQALQKKDGVPTIHVDEVALAVAGFYEKIREVVDWREEHLMRRAAIERMLKRRLFMKKEGALVAEPLVFELIRSGHFPNDSIPEIKIPDIQNIIDKYLFILENSPHPQKEKQEIYLKDWILGIAACEVEETLCPSLKELALMDFMAERMAERIKLGSGAEMPEEEKNIQIYIAVQKALLKADEPFITYNLFKKRFPQWRYLKVLDPKLSDISQNIYSLWQEIENSFKQKLSNKFYRLCEKKDALFLILGDVMSEDPNRSHEFLKKPEELEAKITRQYQKRLGTLSGRIKRAAIYATLSIFATKILLALAIEVPFDRYVTGEFHPLTLAINILTPAALMFFLILTVRPPGKENLQQMIIEIMKIVYHTEKKESYTISVPKKRGWLMNFWVLIFYFLTFFLPFGAIIWGLHKLNFSIVSTTIFLVFISLISSAGIKLRERSKELEVIPDKDSPLVIFFDIFSLPIIQVGKWLSSQWSKYNIIVVFLNFLIELPLQTFIEFLEQWRAFLKEQKEKIG